MGQKVKVSFIGAGALPCPFCDPNMESLQVGHSYMAEDHKEEVGLSFWYIRFVGWVPTIWFSHPVVEEKVY